MKKRDENGTPAQKNDELRGEYRFDYSRSKPNRFADKMSDGSLIVILEPDVASHFRDSDSVNELLRSVARAFRPGPKKGGKGKRDRKSPGTQPQ